MRNTHIALLCGMALTLGAAGCDKKEGGDGSTAATATAAAAPAAAASPADEAKKVYTGTCQVCHGEKGAGDGPGAASLNPKPRDFGNAEWQGSVKDEDLEKVILGGGVAVGKSPTMPGNPTLKGKKEVMAELIKIIRGFKK